MNAGRVMVAYDGSDAAQEAIRATAALFPTRRALVVTVWEPGLAYAMTDLEPTGPEMSPVGVDIQGSEALEHELQVHARRTAAEGAQLARSAGLEAEALAVADEVRVADELVDVARREDVDAIVVGSRGLKGLRARLEGSTATAILKQAPCPVVVVHAD